MPTHDSGSTGWYWHEWLFSSPGKSRPEFDRELDDQLLGELEIYGEVRIDDAEMTEIGNALEVLRRWSTVFDDGELQCHRDMINMQYVFRRRP